MITTESIINELKTNPELWRSRVIPRLVNVNGYKDIPYSNGPFSDTKIIYTIRWNTEHNEAASLIINSNFLDICEKNELLSPFNFRKIAMQNLMRMNYRLETMDMMIKRMTGMDIPETPCKMYVLTTEDNVYGATMVLRRDILERLYHEIGSLYILPSSVHEAIIVNGCLMETDELVNMVKEINGNGDIIAEKDILSNKVLFYDGNLLKEV